MDRLLDGFQIVDSRMNSLVSAYGVDEESRANRVCSAINASEGTDYRVIAVYREDILATILSDFGY